MTSFILSDCISTLGDLVDEVHVLFGSHGPVLYLALSLFIRALKKIYGIKDCQHIVRIGLPTDKNVCLLQ